MGKNCKQLRIIREKGYFCCLCGEKMLPEERTVEHIIPRSKGGTNHVRNLSQSHKTCNYERADQTHILPRYNTSDGKLLLPTEIKTIMDRAQAKSKKGFDPVKHRANERAYANRHLAIAFEKWSKR